jgi:hypothetical protein
VEGGAEARLRDRPGDEVALPGAGRGPEGDVDRPVVAWRLGVLTRAVDRVDDPHPAGLQPVVDAGGAPVLLLAEHGVVGPVLGEDLHQQLVRGQVARVLELLALQPAAADLQQQVAGDGGRPRGEEVVVAERLGGRRTGVEARIRCSHGRQP